MARSCGFWQCIGDFCVCLCVCVCVCVCVYMSGRGDSVGKNRHPATLL